MAIEIDHLGIAVSSIEESLEFYAGALGMQISARETVEAERVNVAMLPAGPGAAGPRIELLEAADVESPIAKFIGKRGPGLHHIALRVDDLAAVTAQLAKKGARLLNEPRLGAEGHMYVFVHPSSAGGVLLELIQSAQAAGCGANQKRNSADLAASGESVAREFPRSGAPKEDKID